MSKKILNLTCFSQFFPKSLLHLFKRSPMKNSQFCNFHCCYCVFYEKIIITFPPTLFLHQFQFHACRFSCAKFSTLYDARLYKVKLMIFACFKFERVQLIFEPSFPCAIPQSKHIKISFTPFSMKRYATTFISTTNRR
jgi:hypothetical protein